MRVLWPHNFSPKVINSQLFVNIASSGLRKRGIDLHLEYLGNLRSIKNLLDARNHLRKIAIDYDLVHVQYGSACALASSSIHGVPKLVTIRGNDWNLHNASFGFHYFHTRLARLMTYWSLRHFDCVLTVSDRVNKDIKHYYPQLNVLTLPSPIDLSLFKNHDKQAARALLGHPNCRKKWVLFNAAKLNDPIKRFHLAKKAFDLANSRCGDLRFQIASDIPHENIPLFTAACDVILCTSETEGWPNCVKEALACNIPFVSTDVSDLKNIARMETNCRICTDDPIDLANNLCDVLSNQQNRDLRKHVAGMNVEAFSDQLVRVYNSLR